MKKYILTPLILLLTFVASSQCVLGTFGNYPPPYTVPTNFGNNFLMGTSHTLTAAGTLTALGYKGKGTGATMRMAIYSNSAGVPGTLIAYTNTTTVGSGTINIPVLTPVALPAGIYWIVADYDGGAVTNHGDLTNVSPKTVAYISLPVNTIPPANATWITYSSQDFNYWGVLFTPTISLTVSPSSTAICKGDSVQITAGGSTSYTWNTTAIGNSILISPTVTTSYTVSSHLGNCTAFAVATISVNPNPTITVNSGVICSGGAFTITPSGANTYTYSSASPVVTPNVLTSYSITGTSSQGCVSSNTAACTVTVELTPTITVNNGMICMGGSFTIIPTGANTYTFSGGSAVVTPTVNSSYTITGSSVAGCQAFNSAVSNVTVFPLPNVNATSSRSFICKGESATIIANGALTYTWVPGGTGSVIVVTPAITTVYVVTGADLNGCENIAVLTIDVAECTGLSQDVIKSNRIIIYPNPSNGKFIINSSTALENTSVEIYNSNGQKCYFSTQISPSSTFDISEFSNGVYFLRIFKNNDILMQQKLIKE